MPSNRLTHQELVLRQLVLAAMRDFNDIEGRINSSIKNRQERLYRQIRPDNTYLPSEIAGLKAAAEADLAELNRDLDEATNLHTEGLNWIRYHAEKDGINYGTLLADEFAEPDQH